MGESTSVHPAARVVGFSTLDDELTGLLAQWEQARQAMTTSERFEEAAYRELIGSVDGNDVRHRATEEAITGQAWWLCTTRSSRPTCGWTKRPWPTRRTPNEKNGAA
jgi:hypothetical protein